CENHLIQFFNKKPQKFYSDGIMVLPEKWQKFVNQNGTNVFGLIRFIGNDIKIFRPSNIYTPFVAKGLIRETTLLSTDISVTMILARTLTQHLTAHFTYCSLLVSSRDLDIVSPGRSTLFSRVAKQKCLSPPLIM
ncbi:hypothetical protein WH47_00920, partial [Habropoda laboriosa]